MIPGVFLLLVAVALAAPLSGPALLDAAQEELQQSLDGQRGFGGSFGASLSSQGSFTMAGAGWGEESSLGEPALKRKVKAAVAKANKATKVAKKKITSEAGSTALSTPKSRQSSNCRQKELGLANPQWCQTKEVNIPLVKKNDNESKQKTGNCFPLWPYADKHNVPKFNKCNQCGKPTVHRAVKWDDKVYSDQYGCVECPPGMYPSVFNNRMRCDSIKKGETTMKWETEVDLMCSPVMTGRQMEGIQHGTVGTPLPTNCVSLGFVKDGPIVVSEGHTAGERKSFWQWRRWWIYTKFWKHVICVSVEQSHGKYSKHCAVAKSVNFAYADTCTKRNKEELAKHNKRITDCTANGCPDTCMKTAQKYTLSVISDRTKFPPRLKDYDLTYDVTSPVVMNK